MSELLTVWRSSDRFTTRVSGITSQHLLSFGSHYDAERISIGPLVALNDEVVEPGAGFSAHRHRDVEIVTWVVSGALRHEDSAGQSGVIRSNAAQRMNAGSGVLHTEANADATVGTGEQLRFIQMWLRPAGGDDVPTYDTGQIDGRAMCDSFAVVASGAERYRDAVAVPLGRSDATLFVARLSIGDERVIPASGLLLVFVVDGRVELTSGVQLDAGDSITAVAGTDDDVLALRGLHESEVLVWAFSSDRSAASASAQVAD